MLPTKDNLEMHNVIQQDARFCMTGCDGMESTKHLFLSYPAFVPLWNSIKS
jgi:hypothetical protein